MKLKYKLYLASDSPRRIELIKSRGLEFVQESSSINEKIFNTISPEENAKILAKKKAETLQKDINSKECIILAADTIISQSKKIFGKPKNIFEAKRFLRLFSNNSHKVHTGICVICPKENILELAVETTIVKFRPLSDDIINFYTDNFNTLDKAGAYGIQDFAAFFVERIEGCYFNVVGFPLSKFIEILERNNLIRF